MKMMGKIIDKMMGDTDKEAFEEMMPALTIKISTDGQATVTKDENEEEEEENDYEAQLQEAEADVNEEEKE
jgi:hypothetical protein